MSDPVFAGWDLQWASGGFESPDPVVQGDQGWTWEVELAPANVYARTSLSFYANLGYVNLVGDYSSSAFSGIVSYTTRNDDGTDTQHSVGQAAAGGNGVTPFVWDTNVDSVTFGWGILGEGWCSATFNLEIWEV